MSHPCADHIDTCDHCYLCDVLLIGCCTNPSRSIVDMAADALLASEYIEAAARDIAVGHPLLRAFAADRIEKTLTPAPPLEVPSLVAAMNADLAGKSPNVAPKALPAPIPDPLFTSIQEAQHVHP